jgi:hypothetical protein
MRGGTEARPLQRPVGRARDSKFAMRPQIRPAVRELPLTLPDDKAQLFVAYSRVFLKFSRLADILGHYRKPVDVGRLGLEPRTKALKGFSRCTMPSFRVS